MYFVNELEVDELANEKIRSISTFILWKLF